MVYPISGDTIRANLDLRIREHTSELNALKAIKINTAHKTLTNKCISGAQIINYLNINKGYKYNYVIEYADGHTKYEYQEHEAYTYHDKDGNELGTNGILRISRALEPQELAQQVADLIARRTSELNKYKKEYENADAIAKKHNALMLKINAYNDAISYATGANIQTR
jgi:hypothetical protein